MRAERRNNFISFISLFSVLGLAVGVTALITVLSVMNGFQKELKARVLGMGAHATVEGYKKKLDNWPALAEKSAQHPQVLAAAPYVRAQSMLMNGQKVRGAIVRGLLPEVEPTVNDLPDYMTSGSYEALKAGHYNIVLGEILAQRLGAVLGSKVTVIAPAARFTPAGVVPRLRRFTVVGIFRVGHSQYDGALALVHIEDAGRLFGLGAKGFTGVRLKLKDIDTAPAVSVEVARSLGGLYFVSDWTRAHANFFAALKTEKVVMFIILTLIVAVAAFNIVSTLIMVVTDKQADIAILLTLGITPGAVMGIFVIQGMAIGLIGNVIGALGGITLSLNVERLVAWVEATLGIKFLPEKIYYISKVPSELRWEDVSIITATTFVLATLATFYPAWRASRTHPAQALRYE